MKHLKILVISVFIIAGVGLTANVLAKTQVLLGERNVSDRTEYDTISVGKGRGAFTGLSVKVTGAAVEFKRIVIHFENGSEQVLRKNWLVGKGNKSRVVDLGGDTRLIDKVVFRYEARSKGWKGAKIKLFGVR